MNHDGKDDDYPLSNFSLVCCRTHVNTPTAVELSGWKLLLSRLAVPS